MEFKKNGKSISLDKKISESEDMFYDKGWFLVSQDFSKYDTLEDLIKMGELYINIKYKGCIYDTNLMNKIKLLADYVYDN